MDHELEADALTTITALASASLLCGRCAAGSGEVEGTLLPEGGGAPGAAYLAWSSAVLAGDLERLQQLAAGEIAIELESEQAEEVLDLLQLRRLMTPDDVTVISGTLFGDKAILLVEGVVNGEERLGEITMLRLGGKWVEHEARWLPAPAEESRGLI